MRILESFEVTNRLRRLNRVVQVVLILLLLGSMNTLSLKHFSRLDITESHRFALSAETKAYLQQLESPVDIWVTLPERPSDDQEAALLRYLKRLLREYAIAAQKDGALPSPSRIRRPLPRSGTRRQHRPGVRSVG